MLAQNSSDLHKKLDGNEFHSIDVVFLSLEKRNLTLGVTGPPRDTDGTIRNPLQRLRLTPLLGPYLVLFEHSQCYPPGIACHRTKRRLSYYFVLRTLRSRRLNSVSRMCRHAGK
jgi:hypothetical protein